MGSTAAQKLKSKYKSGAPLTKLIKKRLPMRQGLSACPYCGLQKNVTADHYLPKAHFPQYSSFSQNLVPSCSDCQGSNAKGQWFPGYRDKREPASTRGRSPLQRLWHPYFDRFLRYKVISAEFEPKTKLDDIRFFATGKDRTHSKLVDFHLGKINLNREALTHVQAYWEALILSFTINPAKDLGALRTVVEGKMTDAYLECRTYNGVEFVFYHAIYTSPRKLRFLFDISKASKPPMNALLPKGKYYKNK
ncbi:hypothetical protein [Massilia varians]|uniref:hypothetical protein n=1 Tax=Massilia varians TaxID=457921 RepID=UPI00249294F9|nr:hypothetical protein [Massilia varians]